MKAVELVVARHEEDLAWIKNIPAGIRVTIYNKGLPLEGVCGNEHRLPNKGREAQTYLRHIVDHYDQPAELTVFCQGKPFDHAHDFHQTLCDLVSGQRIVMDFLWLGFLVDTDDKHGRRLFVPWSKNPERRELPAGEFYERLFGEESPETFSFYAGAQFAVTAGCIRSRPREFYSKALELSTAMDLAPHCLERMWDRIFGVAGAAEEVLVGRETAYLKRIKRLEQGAAEGRSE